MSIADDVTPEIQEDVTVDWLLKKDLRKTAAELTDSQVRYLVDIFYQLQGQRIASKNMIRNNEPNELLNWFGNAFEKLEGQIPHAMRAFAMSRPEGKWALSIHGIGPVLAAGLLATFDIERAPTVGHFWRFAGLDPTCKWEKGKKRPYSASAKQLCWKIGQSFMKLRSGKGDIYGKVYEERKAYEMMRNDRGDHKGYQLVTAEGKRTVDTLPPFIIDGRARRYAVKLFLSHLHYVMYESRFGKQPPFPYVISHMNHAHFISPPKWPAR